MSVQGRQVRPPEMSLCPPGSSPDDQEPRLSSPEMMIEHNAAVAAWKNGLCPDHSECMEERTLPGSQRMHGGERDVKFG